MDALEIFEKARKGEDIELADIYFLNDKLKKKGKSVTKLLKGVEDGIITPKEAVEILQDENGVVVLENQP